MIYWYFFFALLTAGYNSNEFFAKETRKTLHVQLAETGVGEEIVWIGLMAILAMISLAWPAYWTLCAIGWVVRRRMRGPK